MAKDSGLFEIIMLGGVAFAALYLTKQFCVGGALATDAFDGKLCYQGTSCDCPDGFHQVGGQAGGQCVCQADDQGNPPSVEDINGKCPRGYVRAFSGNCVCNTEVKKCGSNTVVRLMTGNKQDNVNGVCTCFHCKTGYKSVNNNCVPTGTPGTVTAGGSGGASAGVIGTGTTGGCNKVCTGGYVKNNNPCSCVCNSIVHKCGANATAHGNGKTCACYCNSGYKASGNKCVPNVGAGGSTGTGSGGSGGANVSPSAVQVNNAKLFLADVINRTVQACCGRAPGTTRVVQGYPSAISSLAKMNNYSPNKILAYNNRPFAKTFRSVVMAIVSNYKLNLSATCTRQMSCLNSYSMKECGLL